MCGIFGIVTTGEQPLGPLLIEAAKRLTYRGYDSVGAATISGSHIDLRKDTGRVEDVSVRYDFASMTGQRGITLAGQLPAAFGFRWRPGGGA
jgi:glucosamine--fructose-6-phosphate aminotransferase (isomerizing)